MLLLWALAILLGEMGHPQPAHIRQERWRILVQVFVAPKPIKEESHPQSQTAFGARILGIGGLILRDRFQYRGWGAILLWQLQLRHSYPQEAFQQP